MKSVDAQVDSMGELDWNSEISTSARFFKVSFQKMLDVVKLVNDLDHFIIGLKEKERSKDDLMSVMAAHQRVEARLRFIEFRISFELGHDLPLLNGKSVSHQQLARDLYAKGAITEQRLERALRGEPSEDLPAVLKTIEKMRKGQEPF